MRQMRQIKRVVTPLILVAFLAACASASPQRVALNSLQGIRDTVTTSLKIFNAGYQAGQFTEQQRTNLNVLYDKYLAADKIAAEALLPVGSDPNVILAEVTLVASDVIKFVQSLKGGP